VAPHDIPIEGRVFSILHQPVAQAVEKILVAERMRFILAADETNAKLLFLRQFDRMPGDHAGPCAVKIAVDAVVHHIENRPTRGAAVDLDGEVFSVKLEEFKMEKLAADLKLGDKGPADGG
jgi:hypothetical protein